MNPGIFLSSVKALRLLRTTNWTLFLNLCFSIFVFLFFFFYQDQQGDYLSSIMTYSLLLLLAGLITLLRYLLQIWYHAQQLVIVSEKGLFRKVGGEMKRLDYRKIMTIRIEEEPDGSIHCLKLITKDEVVTLQGFENMQSMLEMIRPYVDELVVLYRKSFRFRASHLLLQHTMLFATACVIMWTYANIPALHEWIQHGAWAAIFLILWMGRPISEKFGQKFRKWEQISALIFLALYLLPLFL